MLNTISRSWSFLEWTYTSAESIWNNPERELIQLSFAFNIRASSVGLQIQPLWASPILELNSHCTLDPRVFAAPYGVCKSASPTGAVQKTQCS